MDLPLTNAEEMDHDKIDLEKGMPSGSIGPTSIPAPSPTATSSTAVSKSPWIEKLRTYGSCSQI
jgi:hypothetical protein